MTEIHASMHHSGLVIGNETVRRSVLKVGEVVARNLRRVRPVPHGSWHLDEVVVWITVRCMEMWRAVDTEGAGPADARQGGHIEIGQETAERQGFAPTVTVTDRLASYRVALQMIGFFLG